MQQALLYLQVTLVVPWLARCDQELTFINGVTFEMPDEQEKFMGEWITKRTNLTPKYRVVWYSGTFPYVCEHANHQFQGVVQLPTLDVTRSPEARVTRGLGDHVLVLPLTCLRPTMPAAGWGCIIVARHAGRYDRTLLGIFQVGNLTSVVEEAGAEVVILEEPEHLTWYHHGPRWTEKFSHVVSVPPSA